MITTAHARKSAVKFGYYVPSWEFDLNKAYDRVSIPGLLFKLSNLGFSNTTLQWMSSFLMDGQQRVRVNGCLSTSKSPKSGIPQGTVLGPVLFLVTLMICPALSPVIVPYLQTTHRCTTQAVSHLNLLYAVEGSELRCWLGSWMGNALQCREKWSLSNFNKKIRHYKSLRINNEWNTNPTSHLPQAPRS